MSTDIEINIDEKIKKKIKEPSKYHVVFFNDDTTPIDWVIEVLTSIFRYTNHLAEELTLKIHNEGSAIVGTYSHEIAEQKAIETVNQSRAHGFSLQVKVEEE